MFKWVIGGMVLVLPVFVHVAIFFFNPTFPHRIKQEKEVRIVEGSSLSSISDLLAQQDLIRNRFYFRLLGKLAGKDTHIQSGFYALHTDMRPVEILNKLVSGHVVTAKVTFRRGLTAEDVAAILDQAKVTRASTFIEALYDPVLLKELNVEADNFEGYLFPDTYAFPKNADPRQVIRQMVSVFKKRLGPEWQQQAEQMGMTLHEVVIMASMIEKEIALLEEAPRVSAVFHNRLKLSMRLQSDPTVIYGMKDFNGNLTRADLMTYTPYNTYRINGLPPGPISNPGSDTLHAAIFPEDVNDLYFVSMNNGRHKFSETLREHNAAVNQFQRGGTEVEMFDD